MLRKLSALILSAVLLTACTSQAPAPADKAPDAPKAEEAKKVSLVLDWYPNAVHSFVLAAREQGYFKAEGLEVEIKMPADNPTDGIKLVGAGKETFAFYYAPDVLQARGEGIPIVSVAAIVRRPLNGIMVPESMGVKSPKDLEGKQVGYPSTPLSINMVNTMVKAAGGDPAKVTMTDVSWDLIPAIAAKKVEAITGAYVNHEKPIFEKQGIKITYFSPIDFGVPNYYELVMIAGEETVKQDKATVEAMMRALGRGHEWVKANQTAALKLLLEKQDKSFPLDAEVEEASLKMLLPWMEEQGVKFGAQKPEDWEKVAAWMAKEGLIKPDVKAADAFVNIAK